ncbi:hypothetical protein [Aureimonas psammosilenae]|uniref:hypothetical protein n=1 Tax=Aureimonas psammosilenae TaxID=2495496 RepID=UPI001AEE5E21|nr:hypothetical protein [Aureimonas psammosilenae]
MDRTVDNAPPRSASPTAMAQVTGASYSLDFGKDEGSRRLIARMVRVMYPHKNFGDGLYERSAEAILKAAGATPALKVAFATALHDLNEARFTELDDANALKHLKTIEATAFFKLARSTAVVTLYDDAEAWDALGYEGESFDKGGYIHRGFNDLDWLPEPRIEELGAGQ